uniref:Uncharacterized protein n=1 Tax=Medicago truncatula TaxID=3880 RepID=I3SJ16_MEDTR|nr:unknown [Medicago truncatula]
MSANMNYLTLMVYSDFQEFHVQQLLQMRLIWIQILRNIHQNLYWRGLQGTSVVDWDSTCSTLI